MEMSLILNLFNKFQVVGDTKGVVFGGLVEAPLRPSTKKRYQGSNNTFVLTNASGPPVIFRPTGANRYFTLCSTEYLALGGGSHFAFCLSMLGEANILIVKALVDCVMDAKRLMANYGVNVLLKLPLAHRREWLDHKGER
ncbi:oxidation resistance protein 1-like protein [Tanacetum coccineum]|uniref:Oxidation resistance protein 1 n=1 Tax=Tanacetum coccineum TaxID=301880 RepID=A0ABQ5GUA4_9ASTR